MTMIDNSNRSRRRIFILLANMRRITVVKVTTIVLAGSTTRVWPTDNETGLPEAPDGILQCSRDMTRTAAFQKAPGFERSGLLKISGMIEDGAD